MYSYPVFSHNFVNLLHQQVIPPLSVVSVSSLHNGIVHEVHEVHRNNNVILFIALVNRHQLNRIGTLERIQGTNSIEKVLKCNSLEKTSLLFPQRP